MLVDGIHRTGRHVRERPGRNGTTVQKSSEPVFLYLAFPNKQTPSAVLSQIGAFDNGDEFTTILAFLVQATFERSGNPVAAI